MDRYIKRYLTVKDDVDILITARGVAYQKDMSRPYHYNGEYYERYKSYRASSIAVKINQARVNLVNKYTQDDVLDIGVGSGEFIDTHPNTYGYDINEKAVAWLKERGLYRDNLEEFMAFTFWDVIEHIPDPGEYFKYIKEDSYLFATIPIFRDITKIRRSIHYRPDEHLYYFTEEGFKYWMKLYGFRCLEVNDEETQAGRDSIKSFAFKRDIPENKFLLILYGHS